MRMELKNKEKKRFNFKKIDLKKLLNIKNLQIFLISFFIIAIIIGIIFYVVLNNSDKELLINNVKEYFTVDASYEYLNIFTNTVLNNLFNIVLMWIFGISVIGIIIVILITFIEMFGLGVSLTSMFGAYGIKGILALLCYIFPSKILYIVSLFIAAYSASVFSYQMIKNFILKKEVKLDIYMKKYIKILIILIIFGIVYSILEVFITPLMLKLFNLF